MHAGVKSVFVASLVAVMMGVVTGVMAQQSPAPSPAPGGLQSSPSSSGGASSAASPATGQGAVQVDVSSILGSAVRSSEGKDMGKVSRLMIDPTEGRISTVVIGIGGILGMGQKEVAVPWNSVKIGQDGSNVVLTVDHALLQQAPRAEEKKSGGEQGAASPSTGGSDKKSQ